MATMESKPAESRAASPVPHMLAIKSHFSIASLTFGLFGTVKKYQRSFKRLSEPKSVITGFAPSVVAQPVLNENVPTETFLAVEAVQLSLEGEPGQVIAPHDAASTSHEESSALQASSDVGPHCDAQVQQGREGADVPGEKAVFKQNP
jgi:hypothetical protein